MARSPDSSVRCRRRWPARTPTRTGRRRGWTSPPRPAPRPTAPRPSPAVVDMQDRPALEAIDAQAGLPLAASFLGHAEQDGGRAAGALGVVARLDQEPGRADGDAGGLVAGARRSSSDSGDPRSPGRPRRAARRGRWRKEFVDRRCMTAPEIGIKKAALRPPQSPCERTLAEAGGEVVRPAGQTGRGTCLRPPQRAGRESRKGFQPWRAQYTKSRTLCQTPREIFRQRCGIVTAARGRCLPAARVSPMAQKLRHPDRSEAEWKGPIQLSRREEEVPRLRRPLGGFARDDGMRGVGLQACRACRGWSILPGKSKRESAHDP